MATDDLTAERARELFHYDPETGLLIRPNQMRPVGFFHRNGSLCVDVEGRKHLVHRVIWLWVTGKWPPQRRIDHLNGDRADNRWANLRNTADPDACGKLTADRLRAVLDYNPETGVFTWKKKRGAGMRGMIAGAHRYDDYIEIGIDRATHRAHRLAWLYVHGEWPSALIDHKDGNPSNNAISNLREANTSQNQWNSKRPANKATGFRGVAWKAKSKKWSAMIKEDGRSKLLGLFEDIEDAKAAREQAEQRLHKEFAVSLRLNPTSQAQEANNG